MTQLTQLTQGEIDQARAAAQAAGLAGAHAASTAVFAGSLTAITAAATNAAKKGWWTSEMRATVIGLVVTAGVAGLHVLSVIPSPVMPIALALTVGIAAAGYSISRGNVKAAALNAAAATVTSLLPQQAFAIEQGKTVAGLFLKVGDGGPVGGVGEDRKAGPGTVVGVLVPTPSSGTAVGSGLPKP